MADATILMVDDDPDIRHLVAIYLHNEGYQVLEAADGLEALDLLQQQQEIDLIILDLMMPHLDGIQACLKIREGRQMPIIMLSAKGEDLDKILGLSTGADDYVTKPFNPLELVARVKANLRRYLRFTALSASEVEITIGELVINSATHEVRI
ncbi:MAG TPA: response regulator transcription factor, partial [Ktedonobacteraceae bacterium]